jgi:plasmid stabilization system protein ParE
MKVFVRQDAEDDLDRIYSWISKDNPSAAADMVARIRDRISLLESRTDAGSQNFYRHPYIIVYC